jgi:16S rRNA (cytosine(967)-C(5))-methyltransferase
MKIQSILQISLNEYQKLLNDKSLNENILSDFFRKNKFIGSKERKIIQELVFAGIRHYFTTYYLKKEYNTDEKSELIAALIISEKIFHHNFNELKLLASKLYKIDEDFDYLYELISYLNNTNYKHLEDYIDKVFKNNSILIDNALMIKYSLPDFLIKKLSHYYSTDKIESIAKSFLEPSTITIRKNSNSNFNISEFVQRNELMSYNSKIFDYAINVFSRKSLTNYPEYQEGKFEIQDESSMLVAYAFHHNNDENLLDACAGAGGKSLHLASVTKGMTNIFAFDINNFKLKILNTRANRSNFKNIKTINKKQLTKMKFDKILIDAPCTGSGTIRRNPALKYKINDELVNKFSSLQLNILNYYSKFLKIGGQLVYSTCSILPDENEDVTNKYLNENSNYDPLPFPDNDIFKKLNIGDSNSEITIFPDLFNSDGFYIRSFIKTK